MVSAKKNQQNKVLFCIAKMGRLLVIMTLAKLDGYVRGKCEREGQKGVGW